ncbi:hypothetical protein LAZ67_6002863 [Cordylochernes scorpioides]|uniref:Mos1 transposase HTH domain-containing protein n=1 Tax=Cordylochernes scorpioides TaxID=51811 RepID=A0ABY6KL53_9ARAC|nr:hypothetical protein LAZ67_6002863 [Cordylochernes scorpioides]
MLKMDCSIEQRYKIKFCFRLGKTASETLAMITEAYKEDALSRAQVFRWFNEFKNGRESVEDMERSGRPSTSRADETVAKVKELLDSDRRLSLKMIADEVSVNKFTVHQIVTQDLMMRKVCAKWVPRVLTVEQKQRRVDHNTTMLASFSRVECRGDEDMERSGRPSTSRADETVAKVKELLDSDRRLSLKMIADEVSVNKFTVHQIVTQDLMMRKVCAKWVPRVLTVEQKQRRVDVCREMLNELENNPDF